MIAASAAVIAVNLVAPSCGQMHHRHVRVHPPPTAADGARPLAVAAAADAAAALDYSVDALQTLGLFLLLSNSRATNQLQSK